MLSFVLCAALPVGGILIAIMVRRRRAEIDPRVADELWCSRVLGESAWRLVGDWALHLSREEVEKRVKEMSWEFEKGYFSVAIDKFGKIKLAKRRRRPVRIDYSRTWDLLGFLFPQGMRSEIYAPVIEELKEDLLLARAKCKSRISRRWIQCCFALRTSSVLVACVKVGICRCLGRAIPIAIKQWFSLLR